MAKGKGGDYDFGGALALIIIASVLFYPFYWLWTHKKILLGLLLAAAIITTAAVCWPAIVASAPVIAAAAAITSVTTNIGFAVSATAFAATTISILGAAVVIGLPILCEKIINGICSLFASRPVAQNNSNYHYHPVPAALVVRNVGINHGNNNQFMPPVAPVIPAAPVRPVAPVHQVAPVYQAAPARLFVSAATVNQAPADRLSLSMSAQIPGDDREDSPGL